MTPDPITPEALADAILRASGSALRHYHLPSMREAIFDAARDGIERARAEGLPAAARDVLAERRRQIEAEGWTPEHDDQWYCGEIAEAAASYAMASTYYHADPYVAVLSIWPWSRSWLKPTNRRRDLVKAGALILAEIERLDRLSPLTPDQQVEFLRTAKARHEATAARMMADSEVQALVRKPAEGDGGC